MPTERRAFTVAETLITLAIFSVLSLILFFTLREVSRVFYRSTARDDALAQLLRAKSQLVRDLANSGKASDKLATARVPASLGSGYDGDALTFLSSDDGSNGQTWTPAPDGLPTWRSQITYYLVVPNAANKYGLTFAAGAPDGAGYEQQCPCKWLIRRVDPVGPGGSLDNTWTSWLVRPTTIPQTPQIQVVADALLQFRVVDPAPVWTLEMSAVAIKDAMREVAVGSVPLATSRYRVVQQVSVPAGN